MSSRQRTAAGNMLAALSPCVAFAVSWTAEAAHERGLMRGVLSGAVEYLVIADFLLAAAGAAAGMAIVPGSPGRRIARAAAGGVTGLILYAAMLAAWILPTLHIA